jgi:chromosome segregation ATPase
MANERKIVELLAESLKGQDLIVEQLKGTNQRLDQTNKSLDQANQRLERLESKTEKIEDQLVTLNVQTLENRKAIFTLAEKVEQIADLHNRVSKLEKAVYK